MRGEKAARPRAGVLTRFTLRSLAANKVRTAVTVAGIALATALLTAVLVSVSSLRQAMIEQQSITDGVWQVMVFNITEDQVSDLVNAGGEHLDRLAVKRDLGAAAVGTATTDADGDTLTHNPYLSVVTLPTEREDVGAHAAGDDEYDVVTPYEVVSGRAPESAGEVMLPSYLEGYTFAAGDSEYAGVAAGAVSDGPVQLGSTLTLAIGRRTTEQDGSHELLTNDSGIYYKLEEDGSLNFASGDVPELDEALESVDAARTYTVVGFYDGYEGAIVAASEPDATCGSILTAYVSTVGYTSLAQIEDLAESTGSGGWGEHSFLLYMQGYLSDWVVLVSIVAIIGVLVGVISIAAVSLISNAFNISIAERTRQFGLLSSLGASKRQLRRSVFVEAAILGAVGIPTGVLLGIGGAAVAFALTGDGWQAMLGTDFSVKLAVEPAALWVAVALSLLTLVVSAWRPAFRAGRVSAVDAIRGATDIRIPRRLARKLARRDAAACPKVLAGRMPAFLARRTLAVNRSKGRVIAASLAVSVMLLVAAGTLGDYMANYMQTADDQGGADLYIGVTTDDFGYDTEAVAAIADAMPTLIAEAEKVDGVENLQWVAINSDRLVQLGSDLLTAVAREKLAATNSLNLVPDADGYSEGTLYLVDDTTWERLCRELGVEDAADPNTLSTLLVNEVASSAGTRYERFSPFADVEGATVSLPVFAQVEGLDGPYVVYTGQDETGKVTLGMAYQDADANLVDAAGNSLSMDEGLLSPAEIAQGSIEVPVAKMVTTSELPSWFALGTSALSSQSALPMLIAPASAALANGAAASTLSGSTYSYVNLYASCEAGKSSEVLSDLESLVAGTDGLAETSYQNLEESARQGRTVAWTIRVFLYCFTGVTLAIAVANVFNTISSSLMLRTREFAMLRSAGMSARDFRRMIALECAGYAAGGFAWGFVLGVAVSGAFWYSTQIAYAVDWTLPWGHIAFAFALVAAVLGVSAAYALRRTHAMNLVEALRADVL